MRHLFRYHGLSITVLALFITTLAGQIVAGHAEYDQEQTEHGRAIVTLTQYLGSGHLWQALAENWESEFLQMAAFVFLTAKLYQKGSPESKNPDSNNEPVDEDPNTQQDAAGAPWPVRKGGWILKLYEHSLSLAFLVIFFVSFAIHAFAGVVAYNHEQSLQGLPQESLGEYVCSGRFWFESMQNWQSEFLSIAAMVILGIFLRERGSPESKPVATPHWKHE